MGDVSAERVAVLREIDAMAARLTIQALDQADTKIEDAIDHFFWRAMQLLAGLIVALAAVGYLIFRSFARGRIRST